MPVGSTRTTNPGIAAHVTLFEYAESLKADDVLQKKLRALPNVEVVLSARTTEIRGDGAKVTALAFEDRGTGEARELALDGVFVQIGLSPNSAVVADVVRTNRYGEIEVDTKGRTSAPGIYAAGDVAGPYQFTHTAAHQAWYAALNGLFGTFKNFKADYRVIPWCTFVDPEVARVGLNEQEAREQGVAFAGVEPRLDAPLNLLVRRRRQ